MIGMSHVPLFVATLVAVVSILWLLRRRTDDAHRSHRASWSRFARGSVSGVASVLLTGVVLVATPSAAAASATGAWSSAGNMSVPRGQHTATLLKNGKVLVVGGYDTGAGSLASAELYDPGTNSWSSAGSMVTPRYAHTATLLPNGDVLVAGGYCAGCPSLPNPNLASAELYHPTTNEWSLAASMAVPRQYHTAVLLNSGKVLVAGGLLWGFSPVLYSSAELYDPAADTWSPAGSLGTARYAATATRLLDGRILVAGGSDDHTGYGLSQLASAELYDPASDTWTPVESMAIAREYFTMTLLPNGTVLAAGGYNMVPYTVTPAELYDPATASWSSGGTMIIGRNAHTATLLANGTVLATGGNNPTSQPGSELYDPPSKAWSLDATMSAARYWHTATRLEDGRVLVAGGFAYLTTLASAELYTPGGPAAQSISFGPISDRTYGDPAFDVAATASSGLPVSFAASGDCTLSGTRVGITAAGACTITASQAGDASFAPAPDVARTFSISKAPQSISFGPLSTKVLGDPPFALSASASSGLPVSFAIASGPASATGTTVSLTGVGTVVVRASQGGNGNYLAAPPVDRSFGVVYRFVGFLPPVDNMPVLNVAKAGRTIPVKWQLTDSSGRFIASLGAVAHDPLRYRQINCDGSAPADPVEATSTGATTLRYDTGANQYIFNWQTGSAFGGKCYELLLELNDGTTHVARFQFQR